jgi:hypothetical protein
MDRKVVAMKAKHRSKLVRTAVSERRRVAKKLARQVEGFQGILDGSSAKLANVLVFPGSTQEHRVPATESAELLLKDLEPKSPQPSLSEERRTELERISNPQPPMKDGVERFNTLRSVEPSEMNASDYEFMVSWLNSPDSRYVLKTNIDFFPHLRVFLDAQRASG